MIQVAVMSQGRSHFLEKTRLALEAQTLPTDQWRYKIVQSPSGISRESEILKSEGDWLLFLDEDCRLPDPDFLQRFRNLTSRFPDVVVWGGLYLSPPSSSYSVRAYNELCNFWVLLSQQKNQFNNLLGGCLALHVPKVTPVLKSNPIFWGGEDTFLLRGLQAHGLNCRLSKDISVYHQPDSQSLTKIWSRGFLHGLNRNRFNLQTPSYSMRGWSHAIRNIHFWPFWALHFFSLAMGLTGQKTGLASKMWPPK